MFLPLRKLIPLVLGMAVAVLYLFRLDGVGVVGPDEPRYASIGRAMAQSGHFVTPVLWGKPWFEKPPLLYWMTALGASVGLGPDLCGRLPVAVLSLAFLVALLAWTSNEFGFLAGAVASSALATSAGWLTYSSLCLTDLPLAVTFSAAVLLSCPLLRRQPLDQHLRTRFLLIGVCIGLAILAKGLVPVALAIPFCWFLRSFIRYWWIAIMACLAVALPWYWLVYARNGYVFIEDFFVKHHLERLYSAALLHTQPWYYYLPVLLIGLFPWTPLVGLSFLQPQAWDRRHYFLAAVSLWGFVFFSATRNKLPHYLLPILPSLFVLLGSWFAEPISEKPFHPRGLAEIPRIWLAACACLIATVPLIAGVLPTILAAGRISRAAFPPVAPWGVVFIVLPLAALFFRPRAGSAIGLLACALAAMLYLKINSYPAIDRLVSPRPFWMAEASLLNRACNGGTNRDWLYGLNYYRGVALPECQNGQFLYVLRSISKGPPVLTRLH